MEEPVAEPDFSVYIIPSCFLAFFAFLLGLTIRNYKAKPATLTKTVYANNRRKVDYDVVINVSLNPMYVSVESQSLSTVKEYCKSFGVQVVTVFGDYKVGKTFVLGRLFDVSFEKESLVKSTFGLSMIRFQSGKEKHYFLLLDFEGTNSPVQCEEEKMKNRFAQEKLLENLAFEYGNYLILVMDKCSAENVKRIYAMRIKAEVRKKKLAVIFNWRDVHSLEDINQLYKKEVLFTFESVPCDEQEIHLLVKKDQRRNLSELEVYCIGNDYTQESRKHNDRVFQRLRGVLNSGNFLAEPVVSNVLVQLGLENNQILESDCPTTSPLAVSQCFENFEKSKIEQKFIEEGEESPENPPFKKFLTVTQICELTLNGDIKFSNDILQYVTNYLEYHDYYIKCKDGKESKDSLVTVINLPGFKSRVKQIGKEITKLIDDNEPNSFSIKVMKNGYKVELETQKSDIMLQNGATSRGLEDRKLAEKYTKDYDLNSRIVMADFLLGVLYIWAVADTEAGEPDVESLSKVMSFRETIIHQKLSNIPEKERKINDYIVYKSF